MNRESLAVIPYGTWPSPLSAASVAEGLVGIQWLRSDGKRLAWHEGRPAEDRAVVVGWRPGSVPEDLTSPGHSSSNVVNGYGGIPLAVGPDGTVYGCDTEDQRVHDLTRGIPLTPASDGALSWSDFCVTDHHLIGVCADEHGQRGEGAQFGPRPPGEPDESMNAIVRVSLDGSGRTDVLATGRDFYAAPCVSPDGTKLAWICWDQPSMPWDGTELWVADLDQAGAVTNARRVAGGRDESIVEPRWTPSGELVFASDRTGWWSLYAWSGGIEHEGSPRDPSGAIARLLVAVDEAEFSGPLWFLGLRSYDFFEDGRIAVTWVRDAVQHLGVLHPGGALHELDTPYTTIKSPAVVDGQIAVIASGHHDLPAVVLIDPLVGGSGKVLRRSRPDGLPQGLVSVGEPITFPTSRGGVAHAIWYPPHLPGTRGPDGELPPLVVTCHGGPTGARTADLDLNRQFWTTRGFAFVELNYRGSTGYGREYRNSLRGMWGLLDVEDAEAVVQHLAAQGLVDPQRAVIRGLSAGGWTTLQAMTTCKTFAAGASSNGVADARLLAEDTHKFEARYMDSILGPLPEASAIYDERSALRNAHQVTQPLLVIQGLADNVVVPRHAEEMIAAMEAAGAPHDYLPVPGEGHLFHRADNIAMALEAELDFFTRTLPLDDVRVVQESDAIETFLAKHIGGR